MKLENISRTKRLAFVFGAAAVALAAGAAGAALIVDSVAGSLAVSLSSGIASPSSRIVASVAVTKVAQAAKGSLILYKNKTAAAALDKIFLPADAVGGGVVLTSDGWIIVSSAAIAGRDQLTAVFGDKTTALVDPSKAVRDDATGLSFIKTNERDPSVAAFGDDTALSPADSVFSLSPDAAVSASVISARTLPAQTKTDYVESTERLDRRLVIDHSGLAGSPEVNASGEVVGVDMGDGTVVPASFATEVLRELFKSGKVVRPVFGAHFVGLDGLPNAREAGLAASGALITGGGKFRATEKGSAAEAAGLKEGDVITFVEHDRITNEVPLPERLQDYAPGAKVELTVVRAGKELKLSLTLK